MDDPVEQRFIDLETRLAHHERLAEDLSAVVAEQGLALDRLTERVRQLAERLRDVEAGWARAPQDEKPPPHY